jgi:hypothetical protein
MSRLPRVYLLLSSLLIFVHGSCRISKYKHLKQCHAVVLNTEHVIPVLKGSNSVKYKATIDVLKNHFSGLVIVKQTDSVSQHIVFITELGLKMFDFEVKGPEINTVYVFEPMNKPNLISALKRNFKNMLLLDVYGREGLACVNKKNQKIYGLSREKESRYFTTFDGDKLQKQETFSKQKKESVINYIYNSETNSYSQITCKQYGIVKLYFELNFIPPAND